MTNKEKLLTIIREKDYDYFQLIIDNEDMVAFEIIEFNVLDADYKVNYIEKAYNDDLCLVHTNKIKISGWEKRKVENGSFEK